MLKPRPVPWPGALVVKKGSKTWGATSGGMPGPLSSTEQKTDPSRTPVRMRMMPLGAPGSSGLSKAWAALTMRFRRTWLIWPGTPGTSGTSPRSSSISAPYL